MSSFESNFPCCCITLELGKGLRVMWCRSVLEAKPFLGLSPGSPLKFDFSFADVTFGNFGDFFGIMSEPIRQEAFFPNSEVRT